MSGADGLRATQRIGAVAAVSFTLATLPACQTSSPASTCQLTAVSAFPASPLMSLRDAQLLRVPDGFFITGVDGDTARFVHVNGQRQAGAERSVPLPPTRALGPWFAAAARTAPADTLLVGYAVPAANALDLDIAVLPVAADGSASPGPPVVVGTIAGGVKDPSLLSLAMGSSRTGQRASLAWTAAGNGRLAAVVLRGDGQRVGDPLVVDKVDRVSCVAFVPGKSDLSLAYYRYQSAVETKPEWVVAELADAGNIEATLALKFITESPACPLAVAIDTGYVLAWQTQGGTSIGTYRAANNRFLDFVFVNSVEFGGPNLQPPLSGLGLAGGDFAVVFTRASAGEVWRVAADGSHQPGTLLFPSQSGSMGDISSWPVGGSLFSSYADYGPGGPASPLTQRYLVETTCF